MKRNHQIKSLLFTFLFIASAFAQQIEQDEYYVGLKRGWQYMQMVYERLNQQYVEDIDPYLLIRAGIDGMLEELDPYTVFLEEDGERRLRIMTTGKYGGLGMEIGLRNKNVTVIAPISNSPAQKIGIRAGDIIEGINGESVKGKNVDEVSQLLRGKIGTEITLSIHRPGIKEALEMKLVRAEIVLEDIGYSGFIAPGVAYVNLTSFTDKAADEVKSAIHRLMSESDIESFVLDLRGNPGGLLDAAVDIVNLFVPKDKLVVYTKGFREKEYKFFTRQEPLLPDVPLVVMVDGGSASASEIVAGALQDLDRAIIIGEDTFGKGLVQKVYTIDKSKNVKLKVTTSKYYIPSGRCIQKKDYAEKSEVIQQDSSLASHKEASEFYTENKRPVFDKGGIYPDIEIPGDTLSYVLVQLIRNSMVFDFTVEYRQKHPEWTADSKLDDSVLDEFREFLKSKDFKYDCECSRDLKSIEKYISSNDYPDEVMQLFKELKSKLDLELDKDFNDNKAQITEFLYLDLIEKYNDRKERERVSLLHDKQAKEAIRILQDMREYKSILAVK